MVQQMVIILLSEFIMYQCIFALCEFFIRNEKIKQESVVIILFNLDGMDRREST